MKGEVNMSENNINNENTVQTSDTDSGNNISKSSSGSHSGHHHHHHHHRKRKRAITNLIVIGLVVILATVIVSIALSNKNLPGSSSNTKSNESSNKNAYSDELDIYYVGNSKDKNNGYTYYSVSEAINAWREDKKSDQAIIIRNTVSTDKIYRVGAGRKFENLKQAIKQWDNDGQPSATIYVDSGVYITESNPDASNYPLVIIPKNTKQLNIIGEDKDTTVVKSTTGKYIHAAFFVKGGNVTVKNITFIADHSTNPKFTYREKDGYNSAYAVHCDGGSVVGVTVFENCNMWSWQSCALGAGTVTDSHIIVRNCDIRSFADGYAVDPYPQQTTDEEKEEHAKYVHGTRGAIIYHTYSKIEAESTESFTLENCSVYMKGGANTVRLLNRSDSSKKYDFKLVTINNCVFKNDFEFCNRVEIPEGMYLGKNSGGNNIVSLNTSTSTYSIEIR